jgi:hypothetical protein
MRRGKQEEEGRDGNWSEEFVGDKNGKKVEEMEWVAKKVEEEEKRWEDLGENEKRLKQAVIYFGRVGRRCIEVGRDERMWEDMQGDGRRREEVGWWEVMEDLEEWYEFEED